MKTIGVIADTHDHLDPRIPDWFQGADAILHAGDIGRRELLDKLHAVAPVVAVLGNTDCIGDLLGVEKREFNGHRFHITHILPKRLPTDTDWIVFGHTHVPRNEIRNGVRLFNPGSASLPTKGAPCSVALLRWDGADWIPELRLL